MSEPENVAAARLWLRYAQEDLDAARQLHGSVVSPRHVCFLAQQSAEKTIKSVLIFLQIEFPKSHDLESLLNLVPLGWNIRNRVSKVSGLTEWAVEARYPGDWPDATRSDAESALEVADDLIQAAVLDFRGHGLLQ